MRVNGCEILWRRRELKRLSQEASAIACGLDDRTIWRAEGGENLHPDTVKRIAEGLDCNIEESLPGRSFGMGHQMPCLRTFRNFLPRRAARGRADRTTTSRRSGIWSS